MASGDVVKTNHRRGFRGRTESPRAAMLERRAKIAPGEVAVVRVGNDFSNGRRGEARAKSGAKKRLRVLARLAGKRLVRDRE